MHCAVCRVVGQTRQWCSICHLLVWSHIDYDCRVYGLVPSSTLVVGWCASVGYSCLQEPSILSTWVQCDHPIYPQVYWYPLHGAFWYLPRVPVPYGMQWGNGLGSLGVHVPQILPCHSPALPPWMVPEPSVIMMSLQTGLGTLMECMWELWNQRCVACYTGHFRMFGVMKIHYKNIPPTSMKPTSDKTAVFWHLQMFNVCTMGHSIYQNENQSLVKPAPTFYLS